MMSSTFYDDFIEYIPLLMAIFLLFIAPVLTDYAEEHARFSFFYWLILLLLPQAYLLSCYTPIN